MKRIAKRTTVRLPADAEKRLGQLRAKILRDEKQELSDAARAYKKRQKAAEVELARAAELLREARLDQGLSLADVHERSGMSRAAICRLENLVDANPTVATLDRIAAALGKRLVIALKDR